MTDEKINHAFARSRSNAGLGSIARFCPRCNYAEAKISIERARFDYPCGHCGESTISDFYSIGSMTHEKRLRDWKYGTHRPVEIPPPAMPND